jgi:hypothetical protein
MAIDMLELSPLLSTKVPPARTGFAVPPMLLKPKLVPDTISEVTGVDDSVVGADGDETRVAVAYGKGMGEAAGIFMMLPFNNTQVRASPVFAYANRGPRPTIGSPNKLPTAVANDSALEEFPHQGCDWINAVEALYEVNGSV